MDLSDDDFPYIEDIVAYEEYSRLRPISRYKYKKVKFKCSSCGNIAVKSFNTLTKDFICTSCSLKNARTPDVIERAKSTMLKRYGVENVFQSKEIQEKIKQNNIVKYGVEYNCQRADVKESIRLTNLERYGVENYSSTNECRDKVKVTNLDRYGVENYSQTEEYKEKVKSTCLEKYGVESYSQSEDYIDKTIKTNREKYGEDWHMQTAGYLDKVKKTNLDRYGTEYYITTGEYKDKVKSTCQLKYGADNYMQSEEYRELCDSELNSRLQHVGLSLIQRDNKFVDLCCLDCGYRFRYANSTVINLLNHYGGNFCPGCSRILTNGKSLKEKALVHYIRSIYDGIIIENDRVVLEGRELDIYLPDLKIAFEFNGTYWHADSRFYNDSDYIMKKGLYAADIWEYDSNKVRECFQKGIDLVVIKEYDWDMENEQILMMIENKIL